MLNRIQIVLLCLVCLLPYITMEGKHSYHFRTVSPKGGFSYDGVSDVRQDKDGFIWILMDNSLQRFDGYEYKQYFFQFKEINPEIKWDFYSFFTDKEGCVLVNTNNGIFRISAYNKPERVFDTGVSNMKLDRHDYIWTMQEGELNRLSLRDTTKVKPFYAGKPVKSIAHYAFYEKGVFMSSLYNRIYHYDYETPDSLHLLYTFPPSYSIADIQKSSNYLWILVKDRGIYKFDINEAKIEGFFDFLYSGNSSLMIKCMLVDRNENIWIGTQEGLYIFNTQTNEHQFYTHSEKDVVSLPNSSIWTLKEDNQRNIWIGTFAGGLCYVHVDENIQFSTFSPDNSGLNNDFVSSFAEDDEFLWIGTEGGGLNRMNKNDLSFRHYTRMRDRDNSLAYNNIKHLALDHQKRLWIAMFRGGLDCLDTKTGQIRHCTEFSNQNQLLSTSLRKLILQGDSGLWIAYQLNNVAISYLSFKDMSLHHYYCNEERKNLFIYDFYQGKDKDIWLLTREKLYHLPNFEREIKSVRIPGKEHLDGQSLFVDKQGFVWIGTVGNGLLKYIPSTQTLSVKEEIFSYNASGIYSICMDSKGYLWLGTNNGLFRYDEANNRYLRFDENDGLQGQIYYPLSCLSSKSRWLYFGGTRGFSMITPDDITINRHASKAIICGFFINNEETSPPYKKNKQGEPSLVLNHRQADFGFRFSSDNYLIPGKNTFKYRLKGYDDRWIHTDASGRTIFYNKVPSGTYYFEVLTANNDGIWGETPTSIRIECRPAPWLSWYAYLIYSLLIIAISGLIIYYYLDKKRLKLQLYLDQVEKEKKEEIHQSQLRFFTNISHDFRTPLSLILAALDNLKQDSTHNYLYKILNSNAQRLLNLVNELMDFRKIENKKMPLKVEECDLNNFIESLSSDFKDYAEKRNINFDIRLDSSLDVPVYVDKQVVEKIVMNLLNNAFRYTSDGGCIRIESYAKPEEFTSDYLDKYTVSEEHVTPAFLIAIRDTGVGISKESIETVFERFYKVKTENFDKHLGTGIGLALVKSLVLLHKGSITIYSEAKKGTDMVVCLPADASVYIESEFLRPDENSNKMIEQQKAVYQEQERQILPQIEDILLNEKKRVLIVEDNHDLRSLIANYLSLNYETFEASNGEEATLVLNSNDIDLILSDIMMPIKDGITLCREVKNNINTSHIPFILLTAKTGQDNQLEGADSGADIYFEKPIDFNLLQRSIQNIFNRQKQLREYYAKHYFSDDSELSTNKHDNDFLKKLIGIIDTHLEYPNIDVNYIASELSMSRSKLYAKIKGLTGKSIVEFILYYRLRKAAKLLMEENLSIGQVISKIGIKSPSYFTNVFKKEFGDTPTAFVARNRKKKE